MKNSLNLRELHFSGASAGLIYNKYIAFPKPKADASVNTSASVFKLAHFNHFISANKLLSKLPEDTKYTLALPVNNVELDITQRDISSSNPVVQNKLTHYLNKQEARLQNTYCSCSLATLQKDFQCSGLLLCGTGIPHPTETNLHFHHTLGVPFISGSSVKGALRSYIINVIARGRYDDNGQAILGDDDKALISHLFGWETEGKDESTPGNYIFYDAIPTSPPQYHLDVITPHFDKWYEQGQSLTPKTNQTLSINNIPNEWNSPVPIQFLTVKEPKLRFAISPVSRNYTDANKADLHFLFSMLGAMLNQHGIGAKTKTGYGFFSRVDAK